VAGDRSVSSKVRRCGSCACSCIRFHAVECSSASQAVVEISLDRLRRIRHQIPLCKAQVPLQRIQIRHNQRHNTQMKLQLLQYIRGPLVMQAEVQESEMAVECHATRCTAMVQRGIGCRAARWQSETSCAKYRSQRGGLQNFGSFYGNYSRAQCRFYKCWARSGQ
jgi:hypothetical protein